MVPSYETATLASIRVPRSLAISINAMKVGDTQDELLEPCDRLEAVERYGDGRFDRI